jgi:alkanesulfonate monooxygenase SsuD/methylene tetrahydromethanopterin reductase-like flavin-dependent oxidoreductase (luciferase family)
MPALPAGRPGVLIGGLAPASFRRVARHGEGWVAPSFGLQTLVDGMAAVRRVWSEAGRPGRPRVVVERYFSLGDNAAADADHYLLHYYGEAYFPHVRQDAMTDRRQLRDEIRRLEETGCDDLVLLPCSGQLAQVRMLADGLADIGVEASGTATRARA